MDLTTQIRELRDGIEYVEQVMVTMNTRAAEEARDFTAEEQTSWDAGVEYVADAEERAGRLEQRAEFVRRANEGRSEPGHDAPTSTSTRDAFSLDGLGYGTSRSDLRSRALTALEQVAGDLTDAHRQRATELVERSDPNGEIALRLLVTGSDAYRSGWQKTAFGAAHLLNDDERRALERAASLTNNAGGFAVPFTLDPTIILTNDGTANPIRRLARNVTITTDQWNGVSSAGVTASWDGEAAEVSDDAPTLAQPTINVHKAQAFVPFSIEIGQDWMGMEADIRMMFTDARDRLEGAAFVNGAGDGSNQPTGIITALDGGSSEVTPATAETFAVADVYATLEGLAPRYRNQRTSWVANLGTTHDVRQFATDDGHALLARLGDGFTERLLGYPLAECSDMDSSADINAAATADNHILLVGDWQNYVIVDRAGLNVELVPHLFATGNNRPSGQRGLYAWWRVGAGSVNDAAFSVLNVATTA